MSFINSTNSTAVILCGGLSSRMKTPKHELFLNRIISQLDDFKNISLSVRDENQILKSEFPLLIDCVKNYGPLGGILTALKNSKNEFVFVTPCDVPNITRDFINELFNNLNENDVCLIPVINGKIQPLTGIYNISCVPVIEHALQENANKSVIKFLQKLNVHYVNFDERYENIFLNINTPDEYEKWLSKGV